MRVLHVTDCYAPRLGGIEVHIGDLVDRQRAAGIDARVITITPGRREVADPPWVIRAGGRPGRAESTRSVVVAAAELRRLSNVWEPDAVHVHVSVLSPFATVAARQASSHGFPTLLTVHSMWSRLGPLPVMAQALLQLRRWPLMWSAVSDAAAMPLRKMLGPGIEVAVLPNAVDPAAWRASPSLGTDDPTPMLLSVMRFTRTKRAMPLAKMLLKARQAIPADVAVRAVVIGDGPEHASFARFVRRHHMDSWVDLPGRVERGAVGDHLARAGCFVAPARLESFGIAALEARAAGLPVIASSESGVGEFIRHGRDGLLAADDQQMVAAMARLLTDRALRTAIAHHNRSTPIEHDWASALARTFRLYDQARHLASRSRAAAGLRVA